jgi:hypothetical protein
MPVMSDKTLMTLTLYDHCELRRTAMMTIKDLSVSKELDREAMTEVRGGLDINSTNVVDQKLDLHNDDGGFAVGVQEGTLLSEINAVELNFNSYAPKSYVPKHKSYKRSW